MRATDDGQQSPPCAGSSRIEAPFFGYLTMLVADGQMVARGDLLAIVETAKMEASIVAPRAGRVGRTPLDDGELVAGGQVVLTLE